MNRATSGFDRFLAFVLGLALVAVGAWLVAWVLDLLPGGWWSPDQVVLGLAQSVADADWWTWVLLLGGLLLVAVGASWLVGHLRTTSVDRLSMPGETAGGGRILLEGNALADGAAAALKERSPDITGASGRLTEERRRVVLALTATVRQEVDLAQVSEACQEVAAQAAAASGRDDLTVRVRLRAGRGGARPRVH